mmetsp:Transcript_9847/g.32076  ORF Transcript_9847/g.32076 Transcript_9847/m.32076 type:complete len:322 (+) Transcript_9847:1705-2670(+)
MECSPPVSSEIATREGKRLEDEGELAAQTALEVVQSLGSAALLSQSTLRSRKGSVTFFECSAELVAALKSVAEGVDAQRLALALDTVRETLQGEVHKSGLAVVRKLPLHGSPAFADLVGRALLSQGGEEKSVVTAAALEASGSLGNDGRAGVACVACCAPANRSTTLRVAKVDDLVLNLSADTKSALRKPQPHDDDHEDDDQEKTLLSFDEEYLPVLRFSAKLKEAVEWHPEASAEIVAALGELEQKAADSSLGVSLPLRADDVVLLDTRKWLYALELRHDPHLDCRFFRGQWVPSSSAIIPPQDNNALPSEPLILRFFSS